MPTDTPKRRFRASNLAAIVAISIGAYVTSLALYDRYRLNFGSYEQVVGVVLDAKVASSQSSAAGGRGTTVVYRPAITYRYKVGDVIYDGDSRDALSVVAGATKRSNAAAVVSVHPTGSSIDVWYRADDPAVSVVDIEDHKIGTKLFAAFIFVLFGVLVVVSDRWTERMRAKR